MVVLVQIIIAALVLYVVYQIFFARASSSVDMSVTRSERGFAFLSNGSLFYRERGGKGSVSGLTFYIYCNSEIQVCLMTRYS